MINIKSEAKTVMVYSDPTKGKESRKRPVSSISWCTDGGSKIAIGYCRWSLTNYSSVSSQDQPITAQYFSPEFLGTTEDTPSEAYTFNVEDPTKYCDILNCTSSVTSLAYR